MVRAFGAHGQQATFDRAVRESVGLLASHLRKENALAARIAWAALIVIDAAQRRGCCTSHADDPNLLIGVEVSPNLEARRRICELGRQAHHRIGVAARAVLKISCSRNRAIEHQLSQHPNLASIELKPLRPSSGRGAESGQLSDGETRACRGT